MTNQYVTPEHIFELATSPAVDPALRRYDDGTLDIGSSIPGSEPFDIVIAKDALYDMAPNADDWDGDVPAYHVAELIANDLNDGEDARP